MPEVVRTAPTVEEAVAAALDVLGAPREQARVEVLQEPQRGLLGILGGRQAVVRVEWTPAEAEFVSGFVSRVAELVGTPVRVRTVDDGERLAVEAEGEEAGLLIGRGGETLRALEYLAGVAVKRVAGGKRPVVVDVGGYRRRKAEAVAALARRMAARAVRTGREVELRPMGAAERRIAHLALKDFPGVSTESRGAGPSRRVVIRPARER